MMRTRWLAVVAWFVVLAGCAAVTEPFGLEDPFAIEPAFEDVQRNQAMLNPALGLTTMVVEAPRGLDVALATELQSKVIRGLDDLDIAAQQQLVSPDWVLKARNSKIVTNEKGEVNQNVIVWRLFDRNKKQQAQFTTLYLGKSVDDIEPRASEIAKQVVSIVQPILMPASVAKTGEIGIVNSNRVWIGAITGATGDGNLALARALSAVLPRKGMVVEKTVNTNTWRIHCEDTFE